MVLLFDERAVTKELTLSLRDDLLLFLIVLRLWIILIGLTVTVRRMRIRSGAN